MPPLQKQRHASNKKPGHGPSNTTNGGDMTLSIHSYSLLQHIIDAHCKKWTHAPPTCNNRLLQRTSHASCVAKGVVEFWHYSLLIIDRVIPQTNTWTKFKRAGPSQPPRSWPSRNSVESMRGISGVRHGERTRNKEIDVLLCHKSTVASTCKHAL